jgi:hypothetical protein
MLQEDIERPSKALTAEEKFDSSSHLKGSPEEGFCAPKLNQSMIGLAWSLFVPRVFPQHTQDDSYLDPPEWISWSHTTLDVYATAILAANLPHDELGSLTFSCALRQSRSRRGLRLEFVTVPERGEICPRTAMIELLSSLPRLLRAKDVIGEVCYMPGEGCRMEIPYPGKMIAELCPSLRDRPCDLWPELTLKLDLTEELLDRARQVVELVWESGQFCGQPN